MGVEEGELIELERAVSAEIRELKSFEERYRSAASAFVEENFLGGADSVYDDLPDKARPLPRYIDPPPVSETYLLSLSNRAAYGINFASLRAGNLDHAMRQLDETGYMLLQAGDRPVRSDELRGDFEGHQSSLEAVEDDLKGVAMFLDKPEDLPGEPFNEYIELKQVSHDGRVPAKRVDPSDFDFPVENYWPFEGSHSERNPV